MNLHRSVPLAVALAAAVGTLAMAGPAHNAPSKIALHIAPPPLASTSFTAVVAANGHLVRGSATAASQAEGTGTYEVDFPNDVTQCAYVATIGEPGSKNFEPAAFITVVGRSGAPQGVYVETFSLHGSLKNYPFHIDVGC